VADVDADGDLEVLVGGYDGNIYCLNGTGGLEWSTNLGNPILCTAAVADVDADGDLEVLTGIMNYIYCLNKSGGEEWWYWTGGDMYSSPCVADVDADGQLEVLVGSGITFPSGDAYIFCLNGSNGAEEWKYTLTARVESSPCVADVDADGQLEVLVGSRDDYLYCLNRTGGLEYRKLR